MAAAGLAAAMLRSGAEAAEAEILGFCFDCETPDGQLVKLTRTMVGVVGNPGR